MSIPTSTPAPTPAPVPVAVVLSGPPSLSRRRQTLVSFPDSSGTGTPAPPVSTSSGPRQRRQSVVSFKTGPPNAVPVPPSTGTRQRRQTITSIPRTSFSAATPPPASRRQSFRMSQRFLLGITLGGSSGHSNSTRMSASTRSSSCRSRTSTVDKFRSAVRALSVSEEDMREFLEQEGNLEALKRSLKNRGIVTNALIQQGIFLYFRECQCLDSTDEELTPDMLSDSEEEDEEETPEDSSFSGTVHSKEPNRPQWCQNLESMAEEFTPDMLSDSEDEEEEEEGTPGKYPLKSQESRQSQQCVHLDSLAEELTPDMLSDSEDEGDDEHEEEDEETPLEYTRSGQSQARPWQERKRLDSLDEESTLDELSDSEGELEEAPKEYSISFPLQPQESKQWQEPKRLDSLPEEATLEELSDSEEELEEEHQETPKECSITCPVQPKQWQQRKRLNSLDEESTAEVLSDSSSNNSTSADDEETQEMKAPEECTGSDLQNKEESQQSHEERQQHQLDESEEVGIFELFARRRAAKELAVCSH
ncbi:expressed unknown protein [Seminavis robusta]|uniref:Uncharacterized protein n=1 Tax=Seminavis robusta TaxID=568900 RepID=A0A9N8H3K0_9STRA|nr:expressed unknown protein [Seminavis robusta]|eukprot:Sro28_g018620.1 n/a (533) ;mRNA; f:46230-47828